MNNKIFWILTAAALLSISCNKEMKQGEVSVREGKARGLEVRATLPSESKSRLDTDGFTLLWEESDKLAMWAIPVGRMEDIMAGIETLSQTYGFDFETALTYEVINRFSANISSSISDVLSLVSGAGNSTATFASSKNSIEWFDQDSADDAYSWFVSIYPAPAILPEWGYVPQDLHTREGDGLEGMYLNQPYIMVDIPTVQDGKSYWEYQLLLDRGTNPRGTEGDFIPSGIATKEELTSGEHELNLSDWTIETSLLAFTLASSDGNSYPIDHIDISMEFSQHGYDDCFALSGKLPLFFVWDEDKDNTLWSSFGTFTDHHYKRKSDASHWSLMDNASNKVTIAFDEPLTVGADASETIYAVLAPTMCTYNDKNAGGIKPKMVFSAYASNGDLILQKRMEMQNEFTYEHSDPSNPNTTCYPGTVKGTKYTFDLALDKVVPPEDALSGQFSIAQGVKAYIARGNLQAYVNNGLRDASVERNGWRIAAHQYDFIGSDADWQNFNSYTGWIDLFGFSTTMNDHGIPEFSGGTEVTDFTGDAAGWTDCMAASGWRTITADEGVYLFTERDNAYSLFAYATVYVGAGNNPVRGLVFLPDNWTTPATCSFTPVGQIGYDFSENTYNAEGATSGSSGNWENMEAQGAVFWPAYGVRIGNTVATTHEDVGSYVGAYWSGSPDDNHTENGCLLLFGTSNFLPDGYPCSYGSCVRLVRDVRED
ncbi:MAG: hypothetical protein IKP46_00375 [Bacteroidales bacterium]|nr:hypothetical protein [Bacteroidales bacterium]